MKNIHVISTNKLSKGYILGKCIKELSDVKVGQFTKTYYLMFSQEYFQPQNIYITNDEEIKEGDCILFQGVLTKVLKGEKFSGKEKIILTTDQDLINDGVQPIPDKFLEWFVKNPSCEKAEVIEKYRKCCRNTDGTNENCIEQINCEGWLNNNYERPYKTNCDKRFEGYKIIIPKEEPKIYTQDDYFNDEFPKKKLANPNNQEVMFHQGNQEYFYEDFVDGKLTTVWLGKDYIPKEEWKCCGAFYGCDKCEYKKLEPKHLANKKIKQLEMEQLELLEGASIQQEKPKQETLEESNQTTAIRFLEWYRRKSIIYQFHHYHIPNSDEKYLNARQLFEIFEKENYEK